MSCYRMRLTDNVAMTDRRMGDPGQNPSHNWGAAGAVIALEIERRRWGVGGLADA